MTLTPTDPTPTFIGQMEIDGVTYNVYDNHDPECPISIYRQVS